MITVLSTDDELESLVEEWVALWHRTPAATTFQSPLWLLPWWHHFGTGLPRVAISRSNGELTGVLPLYILSAEAKALPIGVGLSDYLDALGSSAGLLDAALAVVAADGIDSCDLVDIHPWSDLVGSTALDWNITWSESTPCPVLALPATAKPARRKLAMNRHRAERAGGYRTEAAHDDTLDHYLKQLAVLHQARWISRGHPGAMADPRVLAFLREAAPGLLRAGLLRLNVLFVADDVAAIIAALLAPNRIFFYLSGFDETHASVSPGTILLGGMLEEAVKENRFEAHFLRGKESYKYVWGARDRLNWTGRCTYELPSRQR